VIVRDAVAADVATITAIYNDVIDTSDAIWLDQHVTVEDRLAWFADQEASGLPVVVAVDDDGSVIGYGSLAPFRAKSGYWPTVENTIHIADGHRGQGVGQAVLDALVQRAVLLGKRVMVAGSDGGNDGSIRFHQRNGFVEVARMPGIGRKEGRPVDLVLLQLDLPHPSTSSEDPS